MPIINLYKQFRDTYYHYFSGVDKHLLAVSGGRDSMCLMHLYISEGLQFEVAHCNFGLRGEESDLDEALVKQECAKHNILFHSKRFNTAAYAKKARISIQMAARDLRYEWFYSIVNEQNLAAIALAHNSNDNAETVLNNLVRGAGVKGLSGMNFLQKNHFRPLLNSSRDAITKYCVDHNIVYRDDSSNAQTKYHRNAIRHKIIPEMQRINPQAIEHINDTAHLFTDLYRILEIRIAEIKRKALRYEDNMIIITPSMLIEFGSPSVYLYYLLVEYGFHAHQTENIVDNIENSGKQFYSSTYRLITSRDELIITPLVEKRKDEYILTKDVTLINEPMLIHFQQMEAKGYRLSLKSENVIALNADKLTYPLIIRKWRRGDKFKPLGMKGYKKLSDFFTDSKMSLVEKENQWLLCSGNDIVWIIGKRLDDRYKIDNETKQVLQVSLLK